MFFAFFCNSVCVASTCSTSDVPMPCASAAEGAMGRGVAVAADDRRARQGEPLLGSDDMNDALAPVVLVVIFEPEFAGIFRELLDLRLALGIADRLRAVGGRHIVVDDGESLLRRPHLAAGQAQSFEGLR